MGLGNKMEKQRILNKKEFVDGHSIAIVKYWTNHPKTTETNSGWHPKFDGSYEVIIGMDRREGGVYRQNTHPKLSWYIGIDYFRKLFDHMTSKEDFQTINQKLCECMAPVMNHEDVTQKVEGLLSKL